VSAKLAQAERAVDEAQQAGAAVRAPVEFKNAQDKLMAAHTAMEKGKHERAIRSAFDKLAEFLKTYPKRNVLIEGHSDSFGNEDFNLKLSQQRADAVRDLLVAGGIALQRIRTKGYGAKFPIVDNDTPVGRQQNRRVEVLVLTEGSTAEAPQR
jgi:outer membrane protein OmpA-like peptidoglycan-associated protein